MKKTVLFIISIIMLSTCLISCSNKTFEVDNNQNTILSGKSNVTESELSSANDVTSPVLDDGSDIEKVIITYFRESKECNYDEGAKEFLTSVKESDEKVTTVLTDKIGEIKIKYKNSDDYNDFAFLYIGADYNVYAKYIDAKDDTAYKIDIDDFISDETVDEEETD